MGWNKYHTETEVFSFGEQEHTYFGVINHLANNNPEIVNPKTPLNFVLGGFHPYSDSASSFMKFCHRIHSNPWDRHILLDQSCFPLKVTNVNSSAKIQARLEDLPFTESSIDYIFLDCTMDFMEPRQIEKFAAGISRVLKPDGLVLAMMKDPWLGSWGNIWGGLRNHVPTYLYSIRHLRQITSPSLKLVLEATNDTGFFHNFHLRAFARHDSKIPKHDGQPYIYDRDFIYPDKVGAGPVRYCTP